MDVVSRRCGGRSGVRLLGWWGGVRWIPMRVVLRWAKPWNERRWAVRRTAAVGRTAALHRTAHRRRTAHHTAVVAVVRDARHGLRSRTAHRTAVVVAVRDVRHVEPGSMHQGAGHDSEGPTANMGG